jgi:hypothetical protein
LATHKKEGGEGKNKKNDKKYNNDESKMIIKIQGKRDEI